MDLKDFFDIDTLFHPPLYYEGEWLLGGDIDINNPLKEYLSINAKKKNGKNMYSEYIKRNYYNHLRNILNSDNMINFFPPRIALTCDNSGQTRKVLFSLPAYIYYQVTNLHFVKHLTPDYYKELLDCCDRKKQLQEVKELTRRERAYYYDIEKKGRLSEYYENAYITYENYINYYKIKMDFKEYISARINTLTKLIMGNKYCLEFFEKEINLDEFIDCFDYDKLCLIAAKSSLDTNRITEQITGKADTSLVYVGSYLEAVSKLRKERSNYNCQILIYSKDKNKKCIIDIDDVKREYEAILARHPDFNIFETSEEQFFNLLKCYGITQEQIEQLDFQNKSSQELVSKIFSKYFEDKKLMASWKIIPKGEKVKNDNIVHEPRSSSSLSIDEKTTRMIYGRNYLESSPSIYQLYGIGKFSGYIGYIYPNGVVIFEKFYENENTLRIASGNATYVMNISNFVELSKLSKTEIISLLKNGNISGVKRIYHHACMDKWKEQVDQAITGKDYSDNVISYISNLLDKEVLSKNKVK